MSDKGRQVASIFAKAAGDGVLIIRRGSDLNLFPATAASKQLIEDVKQFKPVLIDALTYPATRPSRQRVIDLYLAVRAVDVGRADDLIEAWKERIAICGADGATISEAESVAWLDMIGEVRRRYQRGPTSDRPSTSMWNNKLHGAKLGAE